MPTSTCSSSNCKLQLHLCLLTYCYIFQLDDSEFQADLPQVVNQTLESILNDVS